jgi:hypothetical protein
MHKLISILILSALIFSSCSTHTKKEMKSDLIYYLSGENYRKVVSIGNFGVGHVGIPIGMKAKRTVIQGTVLEKGLSPIKFERLLLTQDNKTILQTTTKSDGSFKFEGVIPTGDYFIKLETTRYYLKKNITVGNYEIEGLELDVN